MMRFASLVLAIGALLSPAARAAGSYTETFDAGLNGWVTSNNLENSGSWAWTNGYARLLFSPSGAPFDSSESALLALTNASGGFFSGSYYVLGYPMVGFDFFCENAPPPQLYAFLSSATNGNLFAATNTAFRYIEALSIATQAWYRVLLPVDSDSSGAWYRSDSEPIEPLVDDVRHVAVAFKKPEPASGTYVFRLDNIFLTSLPYAQSLGLAGGGPVTVWGPLRTGSTYEAQASTNLSGAWTSNTTFFASNTTESVIHGAESGAVFQRIRAPVLAPL